MSENTENHTIKLLQEMRREMKQGFASVDARFDAVDARFESVEMRLENVEIRLDGMTHMLTLLAGNTYQIEERVSQLEEEKV